MYQWTDWLNAQTFLTNSSMNRLMLSLASVPLILAFPCRPVISFRQFDQFIRGSFPTSLCLVCNWDSGIVHAVFLGPLFAVS